MRPVVPLDHDKTDRAMDIWLACSRQAHHFIPEDYWEQQAEFVKTQCFPAAETWAYEENGRLAGFASILPPHHLGALFVDPDQQGRGIGKTLVAHCQSRYKELKLYVYQKNRNAVAFYQKQGFSIVGGQVDSQTGEKEWKMAWKAPKTASRTEI